VPGTIDGAKTPHLIPDDVAWRIFFRSVSEPANPSTDENKRQKARLKELDLSEADYAALRRILSNFHAIITPVYARMDAIRVYTPELETLRARVRAAAVSAHSELESQLSNRGLAKVRHYVHEVVKANTKAVPFPSTSDR
jgi:hypothetical protein